MKYKITIKAGSKGSKPIPAEKLSEKINYVMVHYDELEFSLDDKFYQFWGALEVTIEGLER